MTQYHRTMEENLDKNGYNIQRRNSTQKSHFKQLQLHEQQLNGYIEKIYTTKLCTIQNNTNNKYAPHHGDLNRNKPNNVRVVFDTAAICHETSLINNILPEIDFLNNLVSILCKSNQGEQTVFPDLKAMSQ